MYVYENVLLGLTILCSAVESDGTLVASNLGAVGEALLFCRPERQDLHGCRISDRVHTSLVKNFAIEGNHRNPRGSRVLKGDRSMNQLMNARSLPETT